MRAVIARLRAFGRFWWDFVVGDDWAPALAVLVALAVTYGLARSHPGVWWVLPAVIAVGFPVSLVRAVRRR